MLEQLRVEKAVELRSYYDLNEQLSAILRQYFPGVAPPRIQWGRKIARRRRRSIRLGSYYRPTSTIRIHPLLDSPDVPHFFLQSIVFHEVLHHVLGPAHDRRFHRHERLFRYHRESRDWLRANLSMLLGFREKARRVAPPPRVTIVPPRPAPPQHQLTLFEIRG